VHQDMTPSAPRHHATTVRFTQVQSKPIIYIMLSKPLYLASGPTTRHLIRTFFIWAKSSKINRSVNIDFRQAKTTPTITQTSAWHGSMNCSLTRAMHQTITRIGRSILRPDSGDVLGEPGPATGPADTFGDHRGRHRRKPGQDLCSIRSKLMNHPVSCQETGGL